MKIAISGANGFIGRALVKRLLAEKIEIIAIVRTTTDVSQLPENAEIFIDSGDTKSLIDYFVKNKVDGIVHLASLFLAQHDIKDVEALIMSNVLFGTRLLEASVKSNIKWFLNTGTFWQNLDNAEYDPVNLYAATKQAFKDIAKFYYEAYELDFVTIKLNDTFGPEDTRPKIFNLWQKYADSNDVLDMSPGEQVMDISYIDNIIDAYMTLIGTFNNEGTSYKGEEYVVKANERMTLRELSKIFEKIVKKKLNINWGGRPYREREVMVSWTKGKNVPEWTQKLTLEEGIKKTIKGGK